MVGTVTSYLLVILVLRIFVAVRVRKHRRSCLLRNCLGLGNRKFFIRLWVHGICGRAHDRIQDPHAYVPHLVLPIVSCPAYRCAETIWSPTPSNIQLDKPITRTRTIFVLVLCTIVLSHISIQHYRVSYCSNIQLVKSINL